METMRTSRTPDVVLYGPLVALVLPLTAGFAALLVATCGDGIGCLGPLLLAVPLWALGAPTTGPLVAVFGLGSNMAIVGGVVSSGVLWAAAGRVIGQRTVNSPRGSRSWSGFAWRYAATACVSAVAGVSLSGVVLMAVRSGG